MKKSILKNAGILGLTTLMMAAPTAVKAENVCTIHKNYYFFSEIYSISDSENSIQNKVNNETSHTTNRATYFPMLPEGAQATNANLIKGRICLKKGDVVDGSSIDCGLGTWNVEQFYEKQKLIYNKGEEKHFTTEKGDSVYTEYEEKEDNVIKHYFKHGSWYKLDENDNDITYGGKGVVYDNYQVNGLAAASFLPTVELSFNPTTSGRATVRRIITKSNLYDSNDQLSITPLNIQWYESENTIYASALAPALYYVEYKTCEEQYKATINYYYYKDGKTTKDKVEFDGNQDNPYTKSGLLPGDTQDVNSPELKGCTIVNTKGEKYDADKKVTIKIDKENPKDFEKDVYYYCPVEDEAVTNSKTGDALIYIAWLIAFGAFCYSAYYFKNIKNEEM